MKQARNLAIRLAIGLAAAALVGCAPAAHRGLARVGDRGQVTLLRPEGGTLRLSYDPAAAPLHQLAGCVLEVDGVRIGRRVRVQDWSVLDAGEGSAPFVGVLRREGMKWLLDDRNSGSTFALVPESMGRLTEQRGQLVLVVGFVVGPHAVSVVRWAPLTGPSAPALPGGARPQ
jgi:hypothetical protein